MKVVMLVLLEWPSELVMSGGRCGVERRHYTLVLLSYLNHFLIEG